MFMKDYVLNKSKFNKNFKPFPKPRELDEFCRKNKIARLQTITHRYLSPGERINNWLVELLDFGLFNNILGYNEFPYFLQYIYDAWIFRPVSEYRELYEKSIIYEDEGSLAEEITGRVAQKTVMLLREAGKPFDTEQVKVDKFLSV